MENKRYRLLKPFNSWDMNYHLIDREEGVDYLIDIDDFELGLDVEELKELAWKVLEN